MFTHQSTLGAKQHAEGAKQYGEKNLISILDGLMVTGKEAQWYKKYNEEIQNLKGKLQGKQLWHIEEEIKKAQERAGEKRTDAQQCAIALNAVIESINVVVGDMSGHQAVLPDGFMCRYKEGFYLPDDPFWAEADASWQALKKLKQQLQQKQTQTQTPTPMPVCKSCR